MDLEAEPKIDRENPPDLAKYVPKASAAPAAEASTPAAAPSTGKLAAAAPSQSKKADSAKAKDQQGHVETAMAKRHRELADVSFRTEEVLQKARGCLWH